MRLLIIILTAVLFTASAAGEQLKAGASVINVTPEKLPALINGGFTPRFFDKVKTPVNSRCVVLQKGKEKIALVVVDSCGIGKELLDETKILIEKEIGIPRQNIMISSTHTHSAPSAKGALGTNSKNDYKDFLRDKIVKGVIEANKQLRPAEIGWGTCDAPEHTAVRRWIIRSDKTDKDPFGNMSVKATMHAPNRGMDTVTGESGPEDPQLSLISFKGLDGKPIAVLANFSMHYFAGENGISADYFGLFSEGIKDEIAMNKNFVGIMSHGCSGDIWRRDYTKPAQKIKIEEYSKQMTKMAVDVYKNMKHYTADTLRMKEVRKEYKLRTPSNERLAWAKEVIAKMGDRNPKTKTEVYARESIYLHELQKKTIVQQAIQIGDIGIATTPCETYALTGLKIKERSPFKKTMVIELANGFDGYIPSPEQHWFGGYNTWEARSAALEIQAEPKITEVALSLLEEVSGKERKVYRQKSGKLVTATKALKPLAYYRLDEMDGRIVEDHSNNNNNAFLEDGIAHFLAGPKAFKVDKEENRAVHFNGGRLAAGFTNLKTDYSVSFWIWNGFPNGERDITGWIFSRGNKVSLAKCDHLGINKDGFLCFQKSSKDSAMIIGKTEIQRWTWSHVSLVRKGDSVSLYLNGKLEVQGNASTDFPERLNQLYFAGRSDNKDFFEGRIDEVAIFDRAISSEEVKTLAGE